MPSATANGDPAIVDEAATKEAEPQVTGQAKKAFEEEAKEEDKPVEKPKRPSAYSAGGTRRVSISDSAGLVFNVGYDHHPLENKPEGAEGAAEAGKAGGEEGSLTMYHWVRYVWLRVKEQLISVGMISGYLLCFYIPMMQEPPHGEIFGGLVAVVIGITFFMEGFMSGIMPLAEVLGNGIPDKFSFAGALVTTFLLGIACTLAEPAMGALELAGKNVDALKAPVLWYLLNAWNFYVFMAVGLGVGVAALVGTVRLLRNWDLKILIYISTSLTVGFTVVIERIGLVEIVGLAWDTGAVTTGAVTVPIILGLGIGIMTTDRKNKGITEDANPLDSFGIVTLASLYPVICVLILGLICDNVVDKKDILIKFAETKASAGTTNDSESILDKSPLQEIVYATRAVVPLVALVIGLIKAVLKEPLPYITLNVKDVKFSAPGATAEELDGPAWGYVKFHCLVGVFEAYIGLIVFNIGLRYGQGPLGEQVGAAIPGFYFDLTETTADRAFAVPSSPVTTDKSFGLALVIIFTFFMALTATYAEPALNAMGLTTEYLTKGAFKKSLLLFAVATGVGCGVMLGVVRMVETLALTYMLLIGYSLALMLTFASAIEYVSVAWDSAGVTTSSITVPLVLSMGLGLGTELKVQDAFGLLAMGSVGPIVAVLIAGLFAKFKAHMKKRNASGTVTQADTAEKPPPGPF